METNTNSIKLINYANPNLGDLLLRSRKTIVDGIPPATIRAYSFDWSRFELFCASQNRPAMPAERDLIIGWLQHAHELGLVASSISRALTAIRRAHRLLGLPDPTQWPEIREIMSGIRRAQVGRRTRQAKPILWPQIIRLLETTAKEESARAARDACMLAVGWFGALRRSEIVALKIEDITDDDDGRGLKIRISKSKTDPEGEGQIVTIPFCDAAPICPVRIYRLWSDLHKKSESAIDKERYLFNAFSKGDKQTYRGLNDKSFVLILKTRLSAAGFDPDLYSAHSLRAGFATTAAQAGASERKIMEHLRHRSAKTTRGYIRDGRAFAPDHPLFLIYSQAH